MIELLHPFTGKKGIEKESTAATGIKTPDREKASTKKGGKRKDSARSKASSAEMKASQSKAGSTTGAHMQDAKSEISDQDSEINAMDYVPVVKEAEIGE